MLSQVRKNNVRQRRLPIVRSVPVHTLQDADVAWTVQAYRCRTQLRWCLRELRKVYPHARVTIITDGDEQRYDDLAANFGCGLVRGKHWMTLDTCHLYVERLLRSMVAGPETYTFKIDPDTRVWRRFQRLPGFSSIFGTLETVTEHRREEVRGAANVQGGCIGATRGAIASILESGVLNYQSCTVDFARTWARCGDMTSAAARGIFCDDFVISWAAHEIGIPLVECAEIRSRWRWTVTNDDHRYAVTHPHKLAKESE